MAQPASLTDDEETNPDGRDWLAWEADEIVEARAELDAGLDVDAGEIDAWIDSMGADHELPPPSTRHRGSTSVPRRLPYAPRARDDLQPRAVG